MILDSIRKCLLWVKHMFADGACDRMQLMDKAAGLPGLRRRDHPPPGRCEGLRGSAPSMGRGPHLRLDDPLAALRTGLRAPHRRFTGHDPRRHGR